MRSRPTSFHVILGVLCVTTTAVGDERRQVRKAESPQRGADAILRAFREPIPPVVIHDAIFNSTKAVRIHAIEAVNDDGDVVGAAAEVEVFSPGVIIGPGLRAYPVDSGDSVSPGDILVKVVLINPGSTAVRLSFATGWTRTVHSGERLYVGSEAGLLGPCPRGGAAAVIDPIGGGEIHCPVCECSCTYSGGECTARIESSTEGGCDHLSGAACVCNTESGEKSGTLGGCGKVYVPCNTK